MHKPFTFATTVILGLSIGLLLKADAPADSSKEDSVSEPSLIELPTLISSLRASGCSMPPRAGELVTIGKPAVPGLVSLLSNQTWVPRWKAARVLGLIGPDAKEALPALEENLKRPNRHSLEKRWGPLVIANIKSDPEPLIEHLRNAQYLGDAPTDFAVEMLGRMGPSAKKAVPVLKRLIANSYSKSKAIEALKKIEAVEDSPM